MTTAIISHPDCALHEMGIGHPESPARLSAIPAYVASIFQAAPKPGHMAWLDPDTSMNEHSLNAALRAAGALVLGVDLVMEGKASSVFCNVRPPGHHAEHARSMGFCIFNNITIGTAYALSQYQLERVTIVDFDVHHGNGTEDIFRNEPRVLICSTFQHPYYPFTGADTVSEHIINVPLPGGSNGAAFRQAVTEQWLPKLKKFKPQLLQFLLDGWKSRYRTCKSI